MSKNTTDALPWDAEPDAAPAKGRKTAAAAPLELAGADAPNLDLLPRADAPAIWNEFREQVMALKDTAETLTVTDINDVVGMAKARETRLAIRQIRLTVEKKRVELGEHHLRAKQQVDKDAKAIKETAEYLEARLAKEEEFGDRERERLLDERRKSRMDDIAKFLAPGTTPAVDLGTLEEAQWAGMLADARDLYALRLERERKAQEEQERIASEERELRAAAERAAEEERQRLRAENERLAAEQKKEREAFAAEQEAARQENLRLHREREAERAKQQAEIDRANAAAAAAQREKDRIEAEARMRQAQEAAEAAKQAQEEAEKARKAANAPDRQKLEAYAAAIEALAFPIIQPPNEAAGLKVAGKMMDVTAWIRKIASEL